MKLTKDIKAIQYLVKKAAKKEIKNRCSNNKFSNGYNIGYLYGLIDARDLLIKKVNKK